MRKRFILEWVSGKFMTSVRKRPSNTPGQISDLMIILQKITPFKGFPLPFLCLGELFLEDHLSDFSRSEATVRTDLGKLFLRLGTRA